MGIIDLAGGKIQNNVSSSKLRLYAKIESVLSDCRKWPKSQRKCVICYTPQFELLHISLCPNRDMFIYLTVSDYGDIKTPFGSLTHGLQYPSKASPSRLDPQFFKNFEDWITFWDVQVKFQEAWNKEREEVWIIFNYSVDLVKRLVETLGVTSSWWHCLCASF